jgi:YggT family protein
MIVRLIEIIFGIYTFMLMARVLGSWFPQWQDHPIMRFLRHYTDPYLNLFRRFIPPIGVIDISPIIAFFSLQIIQYILVQIFR